MNEIFNMHLMSFVETRFHYSTYFEQGFFLWFHLWNFCEGTPTQEWQGARFEWPMNKTVSSIEHQVNWTPSQDRTKRKAEIKTKEINILWTHGCPSTLALRSLNRSTFYQLMPSNVQKRLRFLFHKPSYFHVSFHLPFWLKLRLWGFRANC